MLKKDSRAQKFPSIQENLDTASTTVIFLNQNFIVTVLINSVALISQNMHMSYVS